MSNSSFSIQTNLPATMMNGVLMSNVTQAGFSIPVASGSIVVYLTSDGTVGGNALFPNNVFAPTFVASVNDTTINPLFSWAVTNSNKTLTLTCKQLTAVLGILGFATNLTNGTVVNLSICGN